MFYAYFFKGKYRESLKERFGLGFPIINKENRTLIWIHAVSVGETMAVAKLARQLKNQNNSPILLISSVTETGHTQAKRSMPFADYHVYMPIDLSWVIDPIIKRVLPDLVIMSETDLWYHFLKSSKKYGAQTVVVNGKISERSAKRLGYLRFFTSRLYLLIDLWIVQNGFYYDRFIALGVPKEKMHIGGNLKCDDTYANTTSSNLKLKPGERVITAGSTHRTEEALILTEIEPVLKKYPQLTLLIVPRHPERFDEVAALLNERQIPFSRYTDLGETETPQKVILVDAMGVLRSCYEYSTLAIVCGSYTDKVGGHNILEPCFYGVPVLFGPYTYTQVEFVDLVLSAQAGRQVELKDLAKAVQELLENEVGRQEIGNRGKDLVKTLTGATEKTFKLIKNLPE